MQQIRSLTWMQISKKMELRCKEKMIEKIEMDSRSMNQCNGPR